MGHLPSIDLVRIKDGKAFTVPINKTYVDKERGHRSHGFRALVEKFQDKVYASFVHHSGSDSDSVCSCLIWTWRSTRKQKVGCLFLGNMYNSPISRYETLLVSTDRFALDSLIAPPMQAA